MFSHEPCTGAHTNSTCLANRRYESLKRLSDSEIVALALLHRSEDLEEVLAEAGILSATGQA